MTKMRSACFTSRNGLDQRDRYSVVYLPAFRCGGGGGCARTDQVTADLITIFPSVRIMGISYTKVDHLMSVFFLPVVLYILRKYRLTTFGWLRACSIYRILRNLLVHRNEHLFLIEGFLDAMLLTGLLIKESHGRYITFPQNVESMVPGSVNGSFSSLEDRFRAEVSLYRGAVQNITISEFDAAIIRSFSASSRVYPFYPVAEKLKWLRLVKASRCHISSGEVLVIGSGFNPPVRMAMESFMREVSVRGLGRFKVSVAGFGTDVFAGYKSSTISILGGISDGELGQVLTRVHCALVPVVQSTGFLTRLVDMNLAGVPIVLFGHYLQASGLEKYGIYSVASFENLPEILDKVESPRKEFDRPRLKDLMGDIWKVDKDSLLPMKMQEAARKTVGEDGSRR